MANDKRKTEEIGQRLRSAREAQNLSTREVSTKLQFKGFSISHATLGNYERGITHPNETLLAELATLYEKSLDWFCKDGKTLQGVRYRCLKSVTERNKKSFSHNAQVWLETYFYIEKLLKRSLKKHSKTLKIDRTDTGQDLASKLRDMYGLGSNPVPSTIKILEDFGIYVIQLETKDRIDGFAGWLGESRVVVLNSSLPNDRIRLNALHELAHHLYEDCLTGPALNHDEIENRAFEFASYMLIPDEKLKEAFMIKSMVRLVQYKELYGISLAAMIYRAKKCNLIPQRLYTRLWRDFSRLGYRKDEPGHVKNDRPIRMETLFDVAVGVDKLTYDGIAKLACTDTSTVKERVYLSMGGSLRADNLKDDPSTINFEKYKQNFEIN